MRRYFVLLLGVLMVLIAGGSSSPQTASAGDDGFVNNNPQNRPGGTLIRDPANGSIYLVEGATKRPFINIIDYVSHNYSSYIWTHDVSADELSRLPTSSAPMRSREGTVYQVNPNDPVHGGGIWIIDEVPGGTYRKRGLTYDAWVQYFVNNCGAGYGFTVVDWSFMNSYSTGPVVNGPPALRPDGQVVRASTSSTSYYYIDNGQRRLFTTHNDRLSHGFTSPTCIQSNVLTAYTAGPNIRGRAGTMVKSSTAPEVYILDKGGTATYAKRSLTSLESWLFYFTSSDPIFTWPPEDLITGVKAYANGAHAHPIKGLFTDRYPNSVATSVDVSKNYGSFSSTWSAPVDNAIADWNDENNNANFGSGTPYDLFLYVGNYDISAGGVFEAYDTNWTYCENFDCPGTSTWTYGRVFLSNQNVGPEFRQVLTAHELGHALGLSHDGMTNDTYDGNCGTLLNPPARVPPTVMDYDCQLDNPSVSGTQPLIGGPQWWDSCGINHHYSWSGLTC